MTKRISVEKGANTEDEKLVEEMVRRYNMYDELVEAYERALASWSMAHEATYGKIEDSLLADDFNTHKQLLARAKGETP